MFMVLVNRLIHKYDEKTFHFQLTTVKIRGYLEAKNLKIFIAHHTSTWLAVVNAIDPALPTWYFYPHGPLAPRLLPLLLESISVYHKQTKTKVKT